MNCSDSSTASEQLAAAGNGKGLRREFVVRWVDRGSIGEAAEVGGDASPWNGTEERLTPVKVDGRAAFGHARFDEE